MYWVLLLGYLLLGNQQLIAHFLEPNCGYMSPEALKNEGHQAHISESPWMAYLHDSGKFVCGGSLINYRFILTAAHCINNEENLTVRLGEFDSLTSLDCSGSDCIPPSEEFEINLAIRHSDYSRTNRYHDIGLLRLAKSVEYKVHIKPICLITNTALQPRIERLQRLVATGWGSSSSGSPSHTLKSIRVTRVDRSECRRRYLVNCRRDQICVSHESGESCSGDSGGPMGHAFRYDGQVVFIQVGIVSYGNPECHSPSVFTDVMRHVAWIKWVVDRHTE
ncbi:serine protease grass isoform X2 [Drosophila subpulchrella]|uniref:serine protease grass isoform X2 n=1 Tax=Drosophila subpulchrella TaxID=1486046 RepID=UPI0018A15106|nr:serine protease grass isoform X2 [Drosophila subpulchrella]